MEGLGHGREKDDRPPSVISAPSGSVVVVVVIVGTPLLTITVLGSLPISTLPGTQSFRGHRTHTRSRDVPATVAGLGKTAQFWMLWTIESDSGRLGC